VAGHENRPRRRRADGDASRQKILIAATQIAAERGYEGTSIGLVSERSGLPASSIYWHFKDKDALIAAVIERSFAQWLTGAGGSGPRRPDEPVRERVNAMTERTAKALQQSPDFLRLGLMLALERRQVEPSARKMFLAVRTEALRRSARSYGELFPDLTNAEVHRLATFAMAMIDGLFIASEIDGDTTDLLGDFDLRTTALMAVADELVARKRTSQRHR
jgi:AcrR family transcriptional regulator